MNGLPEFTDAQADELIRFLSAPERPEGTFSYEELAGFLFAMACVPEVIPPSEWLPLVFDEHDAGYEDPAEAEAVMMAMLALQARITQEVMEGHPTLPPRCVPLADPVANIGGDAPLGRWSQGFGLGYDWLEEAWPEDLPDEVDEFFGLALVTLTFFDSREQAQAYVDDFEGETRPLEAWAADLLETFPEMMRGYAALAKAVMGAADQGNTGRA